MVRSAWVSYRSLLQSSEAFFVTPLSIIFILGNTAFGLYPSIKDQYNENSSEPDVNFSRDPVLPFNVEGADLDRDRMRVALGLSAAMNERLSLSVGYRGEIAESDAHHNLAASLYWRF